MMKEPFIDIYCTWIFSTPEYLLSELRLRNLMDDLVIATDMTVILPTVGVRLPMKNYTDKNGKVPSEDDSGYSFVTLIAESHICIHTWDKFGKAFLEIASCKRFNIGAVEKCIKDSFPGCKLKSYERILH